MLPGQQAPALRPELAAAFGLEAQQGGGAATTKEGAAAAARAARPWTRTGSGRGRPGRRRRRGRRVGVRLQLSCFARGDGVWSPGYQHALQQHLGCRSLARGPVVAASVAPRPPRANLPLPEVALHKNAPPARLRRAVRLLPAVELQIEDVEPGKQRGNVFQIEVETGCSIRLDVPVVADFLALPERSCAAS